MDAVWLTEHHFDGAVAYADPVVFAAAVAMRTHRVRIGFAVVEMALHHPVRLAVQTALVDHLSRGASSSGRGVAQPTTPMWTSDSARRWPKATRGCRKPRSY